MSDKPTELRMSEGEELGSPDAARLRQRAAEVNAQAEKVEADRVKLVESLQARTAPPGPQPPSVS